MTELERARAHLGLCQDDLYYSRLHLPGSLGACRVAERHFLAALSWVWDAQERASPPRMMGRPLTAAVIRQLRRGGNVAYAP